MSSDTDNPDYADDNIWMATAKVAKIEGLESEIYYAGEHDSFTTYDGSDAAEDGRKSSLHWIGLHNTYTRGDFTFKAGGIFNFGEVKTHSNKPDPFVKTDILAGLWELSVEYTLGELKIAISHEGATGDPASSGDENSFQDIKSSHGYSLIAIDNSGGLAIRGSGESSWYGLYGQGIKLRYTIFDEVTLGFAALHFRTLQKVSLGSGSSTWFGDEINLAAEYRYREALSIFCTAGLFIPQDGYKAVVNRDDNGVIVEVMLGTKIKY